MNGEIMLEKLKSVHKRYNRRKEYCRRKKDRERASRCWNMELVKRNICICVCLLIAVTCAIYLSYDYYRKQEAERLAKEAEKTAITVEVAREEPEEEEEPKIFVTVDFDALREINPDIYAWVIVPGTNISYPVVQSSDDKDTDYYLGHNLDGSSGYPGGIYTQKRNAKDFSDPDTVIYGHNMRNGTMFASLHMYEDEAFFHEYKYIYVITEDQNLVYEIFAAIWYDDRLVLDYFNDFKDLTVFEGYLKDISECEGNHNMDAAATKDDKIITLATCISNRPNNRFHVIGRLLLPEEVKKISQEDKQAVADAITGNTKDMTGE